MRFINLSNSNKQAIIDNEDYERVSKYSWFLIERSDHLTVMRSSTKNNKSVTILLHRFVLNYSGKSEIDHKSRNGLDNRKENLRFCTRSQNRQNSRSRHGTSSKYKGVFWCNTRNKWTAKIVINGKQFFAGRFDNEKQAALAYNVAALKYHDPAFVRLNEVPL